MLKYPCLVLDHDDTVVRSEATVNYPSFLESLAVICPGKTISLEDFSRMCFSPGFSAMCLEHFGFTQEQLDWQFAQWKNYVVDHIPPAFEGIDRVIRRQKEAGGLICVSSHSSYINITRDYLKYFGIAPDGIFGWDLEPEQRKPAPYALDQIMQRFGLEPKDLLMVDDLKPGYDMAKARGVDFAWAGWGRPRIPEIGDFMDANSDFVFQTPGELERFLFDS